MGPKDSGSQNRLTYAILIALAFGALTGFLIHRFTGSDGYQGSFLSSLLNFGAEAFLRLLRLIVVPIVLTSLICGVARLESLRDFGALFGKTMGLYLVTTIMAISLALTLASLTKPGMGFDLGTPTDTFVAPKTPSFFESLLNIVPANAFAAMAQSEMLQVIFISLLLGLSMSLSGESGRRLLSFTEDANNIVMKGVEFVMWASPVGVFCLTSRVFATQGFDAISPLLKYFFTVLGALVIHQFVVYSLILKLFAKLSPWRFFRKFKSTMVFAFSTSSSNATLPVTLRSVEKDLGVSNRIASFSIPLGATINMDGTAIMQGVATLFIAQASGIDLSWSSLLIVIGTATLASIGTAGVPGVGLVTLAMVLQSVGLPLEGIAVVLAVDRILDMARTVVNVTGDAVTTCVVARSEKQLQQDVFDS